MEQPTSSKSALIVPIIVVVAVLGIIGGLVAFSPKKTASTSSASTAATTATPAASPSATAATTTASTYKDGTYSATGSYTSPGGNQKVGVSLTLSGDTVTAVTVSNKSIDSESSEYQNKFISGIKSLVVGKKIDSLNISEVSGSSLTSIGFNDAISQIESSAKA